jgi:hypothetical protein
MSASTKAALAVAAAAPAGAVVTGSAASRSAAPGESRWVRIAWVSSGRVNGLRTTPVAPAALSCGSRGGRYAVINTTGIAARSGSSRIARHSCSPSRCGMSTSAITSPGRCSITASNPVRPSPVATT